MTSITLTVTGAKASATVDGVLTAGMVGIPVTVTYDDAWNGLKKHLICRCGQWGPGCGETRAVLNIEDAAVVAHEVMQPGMHLYLAVEGHNTDGSLVLPTTWADCGMIHPGGEVDADPTAEPTLPVWDSLQAEINIMKQKTWTREQIHTQIADYLEQNPVEIPEYSQTGDDYGFLNGLKYYALGDGIVEIQGARNSPKLFGNWYTTDLQGRSIAAVSVAGYVPAIEFRYGLTATNYGRSARTLVQDYGTLISLDYSDVALVTIAYGEYDARTGVPLGSVNSTDVSTFAGALNGLLRKIYTDNPECRVLVLAPLQRLTLAGFGIATPNANGDYLVDFVDMCRRVAEKRSTLCIDQYRKCGINQTNLYYYTVDGVHPVNQGFARINAAVIDALDGLFALSYEPFGEMTNGGSSEPDDPGTGA